MSDTVVRKSWEEFKETGFLFLINQLLHAFGWAIVVETNMENVVSAVYPARVAYRGFTPTATLDGYTRISKYLKTLNDI